MSAQAKRTTPSVKSGHRLASSSSKMSSQPETVDTRSTLLHKEEEYKRLNAELEKKTANLVYEAEQVLKANEKLINETDYLNKISDVDFLRNDSDMNRRADIIGSSNYHKASYSGAMRAQAKQNQSASLINNKELSSFKQVIDNFERDSDNEEIREYNGEIEDDDDEPDDEYKVRDGGHKSSSNIKKLVNKIVDRDEDNYESIGGLVPQSANDMSSVAQIRFLKAKLKVMQEELDRFNTELNRKDEENSKLAQRCKDLDEDRAKQLRISNSHQTQMEKYKKMNEELQLRLSANEVQLGGLKKENDQFKKDAKKTQVDQQQLELRLSRALEEIEKSKAQLQKTSVNSKDHTEQEKRRVEQLQSDNKRLQKQKTELIQAFKKQLKLIDILKKQKMHLEAAKILQFSEEEFINALEWNSNNPGYPMQEAAKFKANPPPSTSMQRPPSGSSSRMAKQKQITNDKNQIKPKPLTRTASLGSNMNSLKETTMLDNLDYPEDENDSFEYNDEKNNFTNYENNNNNNEEENLQEIDYGETPYQYPDDNDDSR